MKPWALAKVRREAERIAEMTSILYVVRNIKERTSSEVERESFVGFVASSKT